jgi:hypothetical protein
MKELIKTIVVAVLLIVALVVVISTRGSGSLDPSKFNIDIAKEDSFSYELAPSEINGSYENGNKYKVYCMAGLNPDGTYRLYFIKAMGHFKNVVLRFDNLQLDENDSVLISTAGYEGTTCSSLKVEFYSYTKQIRVSVPAHQAGSCDLTGVYRRYSVLSKFDLSNFYFAK